MLSESDSYSDYTEGYSDTESDSYSYADLYSDQYDEERHTETSPGKYRIIELSHDGNVCYDQILHQSAMPCVKYDAIWFITGYMWLKCVLTHAYILYLESDARLSLLPQPDNTHVLYEEKPVSQSGTVVYFATWIVLSFIVGLMVSGHSPSKSVLP